MSIVREIAIISYMQRSEQFPHPKEFTDNHPRKKVSVDGIEINYLSSGRGKRTMVIFPGGLQTAESCFDKDNKVVVLNVDGPKIIDQFCKLTENVLKQEAVENYTLMGLSLGGMLAQSFVRRTSRLPSAMVFSHTAAPNSETFIKNVVQPMKLVQPLLPIVPIGIFREMIKRLGGKVQLRSKLTVDTVAKEPSKLDFVRGEYAKQMIDTLPKPMIETTVALALNYHHKKFNPLHEKSKRILILRTDNDPLAQDDGRFAILYPKAKVVTFSGTGHLTAFLQFEKYCQEIRTFLTDIG